MKRVLYWVLVIACLGGVLMGGYMTVSQLLAYQAADRAYKGLSGYISGFPLEDASGNGGVSCFKDREASENAGESSSRRVQVDFSGLAGINPQVVGWIYGPDTVINYPIVQGEDNAYYLHHLFTGEANGSGCIFLDAACAGDFSGEHSIIYGHHMKNGSMFASLGEYASQDYYESHPYFQLSTPAGDWRVDVFSAYAADVSQEAWQVELGEEYRQEWIRQVSGRSAIRCRTAPKEGERILTLSTCSYEFADARFVVHGVMRPWE